MTISNEFHFIGKFDSIQEAMLHPNCHTPGSVIVLSNNATYILDDNNTWHLLNHSHSEHEELMSAIIYYENKAKYGDEFCNSTPEPDSEKVAQWLSLYEESTDWISAAEEAIVCQNI